MFHTCRAKKPGSYEVTVVVTDAVYRNIQEYRRLPSSTREKASYPVPLFTFVEKELCGRPGVGEFVSGSLEQMQALVGGRNIAYADIYVPFTAAERPLVEESWFKTSPQQLEEAFGRAFVARAMKL